MPVRHSVVTIAGRNKEAAKTAANEALVFTEIALGDGVRYPAGGETELENEVHRGLITGSGVEGGTPNAVWFDLYAPAETNTFYAQEIGLFDEDGLLYALSRFAEPVPKFGPDSSSTSDNTFRIIVVFSDTENVIVQTSPVAGLTADTLGQHLPWATAPETADPAAENKIIDPKRLHGVLGSLFPWATTPEAADPAVESKMIDPKRLHGVLGTLFPWADDVDALDPAIEDKIIDPNRLWKAIQWAFDTWPQAGVMTCICAIDQAGAVAAGLVAGGYWLDSDAADPKIYSYDGATSTEIAPKPNAVWCSNSNTLWIRGLNGVLTASLQPRRRWVSSALTQSASTQHFSVPHGLGETPDECWALWICTADHQGFTVGRILPMTSFARYSIMAAMTSADETHVYYTRSATIFYDMLPDGAGGYLDLTKWDLYLGAAIK